MTKTIKTIYLKDGSSINTDNKIFFFPDGIRFANNIIDKSYEIPYNKVDYIK